VVALPAFNATLSPKELASNVAPLLQRERPSAGFMVELQLAPKPNKADSVVPRLKPFTAMKRTKHELSEPLLCVNLGL
jgi:hypothetical protein